MDIEIKIGREVSGEHVIIIPSTYKRVSRKHASLIWHNGTATIEDNESSNGTFVNGRRIAKAKIQESDVVWLGGQGEEGSYQLDLRKVFESCCKAENAQRTDYSQEFEDIKQAYIDYQQEVSQLKTKVAKQSQMPKILASLVPAIIGVIFYFVFGDPNVRYGVMLAGTALSGLATILTISKSTAVNDQISEEITELQIKYQPRYCCPKCGMKYPFTTHWKKLEAEGKCPNPKCNAMFVKR